MNNFMKQAQQLQAKMAKVQKQLGETVLETTSGGGAVTVTIDGQMNIRSIKISPEVVDPEDVEMLEDLVLAAVTDAMGKAQELASQQLGGLTGGMKIPGLM